MSLHPNRTAARSPISTAVIILVLVVNAGMVAQVRKDLLTASATRKAQLEEVYQRQAIVLHNQDVALQERTAQTGMMREILELLKSKDVTK